ncbi:hypothetical protein Tco_0836218 [Tanacetum coccineum]
MIPKLHSAEWIRFLLMVIEWEVAKNLLHLWLSLGVRGVEKKCLDGKSYGFLAFRFHITCIEPNRGAKIGGSVRIISGLAGLVQRTKLLKENVFILDPDGVLMSTQEYMHRVIEDVGENVDFNSGAWVRPLTCECFLVHYLNVTLKDVSGTIHYKVLDVGSYEKDITVGAAMILVNVSVFTPKPSKHYLNITKRNVVEVFRKDTVEIKEDTKNKKVRIFFDAGMVLRPLLVVQNLHKFRLLKGGSHSSQDLLDSGIVELIGPEEEEDCRTAWEASILNQAQKEQVHGPRRGSNFPLGAGHRRLCKQMTKNIVVNMTLPEIQCLLLLLMVI